MVYTFIHFRFCVLDNRHVNYTTSSLSLENIATDDFFSSSFTTYRKAKMFVTFHLSRAENLNQTALQKSNLGGRSERVIEQFIALNTGRRLSDVLGYSEHTYHMKIAGRYVI